MPITIGDYRELLSNVRRRPLMYLIRSDFATIVAYVAGIDQAHGFMFLRGFREWLVTQLGCADQHVWWSLVARLTLPVGPKPLRDMDAESDARAVETLFDLLDEFLELRDESDGMRRIYGAYNEWKDLRTSDGCLASDATACPTVKWPRSRTHCHGGGPSTTSRHRN